MKKTIAVGLGGGAGTLVRFAFFQIPLPAGDLSRPLITLLINLLGSFLLGLVLELFAERIPVNAEIRLAVTTGFMGGFTTFSTFCKDFILLFLAGDIFHGILYASVSLFLGVPAAWVGMMAAKRTERRKAR